MFDIQSTLSFNKESLVAWNKYDYITRTSQNQWILQETWFVNEENINSAWNWSLWLLQMDFFYRHKPWYAGQFVRKITPKIQICEKAKLFFTVLLNQQKTILLSVLVRDVDKTFKNLEISLPTKNWKIDFDFMESFIAELEAEKIAELNNYLQITWLKDYNLTSEEEKVLADFENGKFEWGEFKFEDIWLKLLSVKNKLSKSDLEDWWKIPVYSSESTNNWIIWFTNIEPEFVVSDKNLIYLIFWDHTRSFNIAKESFLVADNVKVLSINNNIKINSLFFINSSWKKWISDKWYSRHWSIAKESIFQLPIKNGEADYKLMETFISAIQKLVVKDLVEYVYSNIN